MEPHGHVWLKEDHGPVLIMDQLLCFTLLSLAFYVDPQWFVVYIIFYVIPSMTVTLMMKFSWMLRNQTIMHCSKCMNNIFVELERFQGSEGGSGKICKLDKIVHYHCKLLLLCWQNYAHFKMWIILHFKVIVNGRCLIFSQLMTII